MPGNAKTLLRALLRFDSLGKTPGVPEPSSGGAGQLDK
jgi:hypothetical protein